MRWLQQPHSHPYSVGNYPTVISYLLSRNSSGVGNSGGDISGSRGESSGSGGGKGSGTSIFSSNGSGGGGSNGSGSSGSGNSSGIGGWC